MIYLKLEGNSYQYEIEEVIKLFYPAEETAIYEDEPPVAARGIFLLCAVHENSTGTEIHMKLAKDGLVKAVRDELLQQTPSEKDAARLLKKEIKRQVYLTFASYTGREMPWGILTGIRPAKIVREMLEENIPENGILHKLEDYYRISAEKSELALSVAKVECKILSSSRTGMIGVYIGIPFCTSRCLYCSFTSNSIERYGYLVQDYLDALKKEIQGVNEIIAQNGYGIQSIYIGGGTPTSLDSLQLEELLDCVETNFSLGDLEEYTLEAGRPDSINPDKLKAIKNSRVTRISINPQTMNSETLKLIGRNHTPEDIVNAFEMARKAGFDNINMDVIIGLPGENPSMFENTLKEIKKLDPESLTAHTMSIKRASRLHENMELYRLTSGENAVHMVSMAQIYAKSMDMHPYYLYRQKNILGNLENVGYCKSGKESIYNVQIMEEKQTIMALGAGAVTKVVYAPENRIERAFNVKNVEEYIKRVDEMLERKRVLLKTI